MNDPLSGWFLPAMMFGLMFAMGLALTPQDFRRILQVPGPVITGTLLQLVAMPLIAFSIALLFDLPPLLALGLMVCGACPGGMGSNLFIYYAGANTALSISLTTVATAVSLVTLPLWIGAMQAALGQAAGGVTIPLLDMVVELGALTVLPVAAGVFTRSLHDGAHRLERPLALGSTLGLVGFTVLDSMDRPSFQPELFAQSFAPVAILVGAAFVFGYLVPRWLGQSVADAVTISVELCVRNILLGIVVVSISFNEFEPNIPLFLYSGLMIPPAVLALLLFRRSHRG